MNIPQSRLVKDKIYSWKPNPEKNIILTGTFTGDFSRAPKPHPTGAIFKNVSMNYSGRYMPQEGLYYAAPNMRYDEQHDNEMDEEPIRHQTNVVRKPTSMKSTGNAGRTGTTGRTDRTLQRGGRGRTFRKNKRRTMKKHKKTTRNYKK